MAEPPPFLPFAAAVAPSAASAPPEAVGSDDATAAVDVSGLEVLVLASSEAPDAGPAAGGDASATRATSFEAVAAERVGDLVARDVALRGRALLRDSVRVADERVATGQIVDCLILGGLARVPPVWNTHPSVEPGFGLRAPGPMLL